MRARRAEASRALPGALVLSLLALLTAVGGCSTEPPPAFTATEVSGVDYGHEVVIPDTEGKLRRLKDFSGQVTVVFFGFTRCPDVCPTTLLRLKTVRDSLGTEADRVQIVLVTVDPERDTTEALRAYLDRFDLSFLGLRPDPDKLTEVVQAFHAIAEQVPSGADGDYTVDHSSTLYVYDRRSRLRLIAQPDIDPAGFARDLRYLATETP